MAKLHTEFPQIEFNREAEISKLKDLLADLTAQRKSDTLSRQVVEIKDYKLYDDIQNTFKQIEKKELYDAPLMLEWNTWRAMTMLDGGDIKANLIFDDLGTHFPLPKVIWLTLYVIMEIIYLLLKLLWQADKNNMIWRANL